MAVLGTAMSVTWAGTSVLARLTDSAAIDANTFTTAASFCASTSNLTATQDTYVDEDSSSSNYGSNTSLKVFGDDGKWKRFFVDFTLPTLPAGCTVTSATLTFTKSGGSNGVTLSVQRATSTWAEGTLDWSPQPGVAGTAVTGNSAATTSFTVTALVAGMYPSSAYGFRVRANNEDSDDAVDFYSSEGTTPPTLQVIIG